jgi:uncharacterized membrane protein
MLIFYTAILLNCSLSTSRIDRESELFLSISQEHLHQEKIKVVVSAVSGVLIGLRGMSCDVRGDSLVSPIKDLDGSS